MENKVTSSSEHNQKFSTGNADITLTRDQFARRLKQAERAGMRKLLEEAGLPEETTVEQLKMLLHGAKDTTTAGKQAEEYQQTIAQLEEKLAEVVKESEEKIINEKKLREKAVVRESLLRAYLENGGLTVDENPNARETAINEMLNMSNISFRLNDDNSVTIISVESTGQTVHSLNDWVKDYLEQRPYLMQSKVRGAGIGRIDAPLSTFNSNSIRTSANDRISRLELGRSL
jgi:tRNA splicing endonuclease